MQNDLTAPSLHREFDAGLRGLQTDLYQMHWPDPDTPIEESMEALREIQAVGKIRHIGVSTFSLGLFDRALAVGPVATFQGLMNMPDRNPDS